MTKDESPTQWLLPPPTISDRDTAVEAGTKALGDRELIEEFVQSPEVNTPSFRHQRAVSTTAEARKLTRRGYVENHATLHFAKWWGYLFNNTLLLFWLLLLISALNAQPPETNTICIHLKYVYI